MVSEIPSTCEFYKIQFSLSTNIQKSERVWTSEPDFSLQIVTNTY